MSRVISGVMGVPERVAALGRFVEAARGHVPSVQLAPAEELVARVGERLALSREHTVVALAGSTGTGKSSIFNALAGKELSATGVRRPTTGDTHACVFGGDPAGELLDWLGVRRRSRRDAVSGLDGLVLLDLPDFDSVEASHRIEADRLLAVVDLIVWVLHPQKYADKVVHRGYLDRFHRHRDITVVVLNQADLLSEEDLAVCLEDLKRLLAEDGLGGVPVVTASTVAAPGLEELHAVLAKAVAARQAALRRLAADLDGITAAIDLGQPPEPLGGKAKARLVEALASAAGVPAVATAVEKAYVHRARKVTGWPPLRWLRRFRPDPLARLHLSGDPRSATSLGPPTPAALGGVSLAMRELAPREGPWSESIVEAARSRMDDLPDALDQAVARTDLGPAGPRLWWRFFGILQWIAVGAAAAGLAWLAVRYVLFALALPEPPLPQWGRLPLPTALFVGGLLTGLLLALLVRPIVRVAARRRRRRVEKAMRANVSRVGDELILGPATAVVDAHGRAASALREAAGSESGRGA